MSFLEKLTETQHQTIIRLPYRIGLWVSQSDTSGGSDADDREKQALSNILHGFAEDVFGSETIQHIISATIRQKSEWSGWGINLELVPDDCRIAIEVLREHGDEKDANAFKRQLMEIAEAVALAFREHEQVSVFAAFGMYVSYMFSGSKKAGRKRTFDEFLNISASERKTLSAISDALEAA